MDNDAEAHLSRLATRRFEGRRAVVTGTASGIGRAVAARIAAEGGRVVGIDRQAAGDPDDLGVLPVIADLADPLAIDAALEAAVSLLGGAPDVVVNAAGVYLVRTLIDTSQQDWDDVQAVNLRAPFLIAQAAVARGMRDGGVIVNVSSVAADGASAREPSGAYNASKAGLANLTRQMAVEWAQRSIRVVAVAPGVIDTPMLRLMDDPVAGRAYLDRAVPLRRLGRADEVASVVCFLATSEASYVTGTTVVVDGGLLAT